LLRIARSPLVLNCKNMTDPTDTSFFGDIFGEAGTTKTFEAKNVEVSERPEVAFQPEIEEPVEEKVSEEVQKDSSLHPAELRKKRKEKGQKKRKIRLEDAIKEAELNRLKKAKLRDPEKEARTVFVGNLPANANKKALKKMFKVYDIESIRFRSIASTKPIMDRRVVVYKGHIQENSEKHAYIVMKTKDSAQEAAKDMNGFQFQGNQLRVDLARGSKRDDSRCIFVGNLRANVTDQSLIDLFKDCGQIEYVRPIRDNLTRLCKGIGYVCFVNQTSIPAALTHDGHKLGGRKIRVSRCDPRFKAKKQMRQNIAKASAKRGKQDKKSGAKGKKGGKGKQDGGRNTKFPKFTNTSKKRGADGKKLRWREQPEMKEQFQKKREERMARKGKKRKAKNQDGGVKKKAKVADVNVAKKKGKKRKKGKNKK